MKRSVLILVLLTLGLSGAAGAFRAHRTPSKPLEGLQRAANAAEAPFRAQSGWQIARVTAYAVDHGDVWLTGCRWVNGTKTCYTACGGTLDDSKLTVASNPSLGLACGTRVKFLKWANGRFYRATATVTDRTGSYFDFEFSVALVGATGGTLGAGWDSPRWISWKRA